MLDPLATPADAAAFGYPDISEAALRRASTRIREAARQQITSGASTIQASGPTILLPQRPVQTVSSVTAPDGVPVAWALEPGGILSVATAGTVEITYSHGYGEIPESLVELTLTVASRLDSLHPGLAAGVQNAGTDGGSVGFGWDAYKGISGLTTAEMDRVKALFPVRRRKIVSSPR